MKILSNFKLNNSIESTSKLLLTLLLAISTLSLACSSSSSSNNNNNNNSNGEDPLPPAPTGLFLRPTDEANFRVYSNGDSTIENADDGTETRTADTLDKGLLKENADGSSASIEIGTFSHDDDANKYWHDCL